MIKIIVMMNVLINKVYMTYSQQIKLLPKYNQTHFNILISLFILIFIIFILLLLI
jgi:hypothetical protein